MGKWCKEESENFGKQKDTESPCRVGPDEDEVEQQKQKFGSHWDYLDCGVSVY